MLVHANEATATYRRVYFHLVDATDGITPETGEASGQPQISVDGAAWTNTGIGTLTAIGNGRYYADLTQATVATAGTIVETRYKSANTAECPGDTVQVVAFNPRDAVRIGLSALPNAAADAAGGLPISDAGGLDLDAKIGALSFTGGNVHARAITIADDTISEDTMTTGIKDLLQTLNTSGNNAVRDAVAAKLLKYFQLLMRSDSAIGTDNATELTEINADGGSGAGDFSNQTEAVEALRDWIGNGSNLTEAGGTGDHLTALATQTSVNTLNGKVIGTIAAGTHVAQTGDSYAIVNARLVGTIGAGTHVAQTGDSYSIVNSGTFGNSSIKAVVDSVSSQSGTLISGQSSISTQIGNLNDLSTSDVKTQVDASLVGIHLDHLFAATYDPAAQPGVSDALMNELIESDAGVSRFTANALEQAPSVGGGLTQQDVRDAMKLAPSAGAPAADSVDADLATIISGIGGISAGSAPQLLQTTTIATLASQTSFTLTAGSADPGAYGNGNAFAIIVDQSTSTQKDAVPISAYTSGRTVTLGRAPVFTIAEGDTVHVIAQDKEVASLSQNALTQLAGTTITTSIPTWTSTGFDSPIVKGDSYTGDRKLQIRVSNWPGQDLSTADSITLTAYRGATEFSWTMTHGGTESGGTVDVLNLTLSTTDTNQQEGIYRMQVQAVSGSNVETVVKPSQAKLEIVEDYKS